MKKTKYLVVVILLLFSLNNMLNAQSFLLHGNISSARTNEPLSFANLRVLGTTFGTAANIEGDFELKLAKGNYRIIASFIGFKSDTINISLSHNIKIQIDLEPIELKLQEVTVLPKENPAINIIRKAIIRKQEREKLIQDYSFTAYTKGLIKTTKDISTSDNSVGIGLGEKDTAELKITGILENQSKGFFKKPKFYKEEIIARKQTANFPPSINTLTGGRVIQNFYTDDIKFFNRDLLSPISDDALDFYYYFLEDSLALDDKKVYQIFFEPEDKSDPGFQGKVYILNDSYDMVKLDIDLNSAANPGGIFSKINIYQQFMPFESNIYMPIDYRLFVEGNFLGLVKFGFELNSIMYDYKINTAISEDFFDRVIVKVLPDADKKDSLYWQGVQIIPNTRRELFAYERIDSIESIPKSFSDRFSWLATQNSIDDDWSISGPLGIYSFNPIEGNEINFGVFYNDRQEKRFSFSIKPGYGFSDKKFKWNSFARYLFGDYRTITTELSVYDDVKILFGNSDEYNSLTSTLTSLFGHYDFRDYYYTKGMNAKVSADVFSILRLGAGLTIVTDNTAYVTTQFSLFNKKKSYSVNQPIMNSTMRYLSFNWQLDFRNFIEDGYFRRRISEGKSNIILSGESIFSYQKLIPTSFDFNQHTININSRINSFKSTSLDINVTSSFTMNALPIQFFYALPGNIKSSGKDFTFRTLAYNEIFSDNSLTINTQYNFGDYLFKLLSLPYIKDLQLQMSIYFNTAWTDLSAKSIKLNKHIFQKEPVEFNKPFYEIGFSLWQILFPIKFEFTWKLNYFGKNNFVFGINSFVL